MNSRPFPLYFSLLVGACSLAASASAQDQTINGNLFVNASLDVNGNTASFGTNGANPGYSLIYTNGTPATVDFSASAAGVNWIWSQATNQPQLKLASTNTLSLFAPGSASASITLNPAGTSTFSQGLTVTGTLTATGGLSSPNGIVTGGATGLSLQAGGTGNQNITLVPTGTGVTTTASPVTVTNATASTSTSTGALVVTGGVGVNGTLTAGNITTGGTVSGTTVSAGTLRVTNIAPSLTNLGLGVSSNADFGAINAGDPALLRLTPVARLTHVATGPFLSAPQVVTVSGNFAYVGSSSSTSLQIIDITDPLAPVRRGALVGNGSAGAANLSYPRGIAISGNFAYVTSQTNNALQVVNITNPAAPITAGSLINGAGGALLSAPYGIATSGSYAYIASSGSNALQIVNITNPAAPVAAGKLVDATALLGARAVAVSGNYAYVVSTTGNRFAVVNISNPAAPSLVTSLAHNAAGPLLAGATAIFLSGNHAYVTSATSNALQIIDISNPALPVARGSLVSGTAGAQLLSPTAVSVVGTLAYVTAGGTTKGVQIIDVSNPLAPTPKGQLLDTIGGAALNGPTGIAISGNYAYVTSAGSNNALQVLSVTPGGGFQVKGSTVLTTNSANDVLLGSGLPAAKVAIGTANATSRLTVAGTDTTAANSVVNFTDSANKSLLVVQNDGKVGIGTSSPAAKLSVAGDVLITGNLKTEVVSKIAPIVIRGTGLHHSAPRLVSIGNTQIALDGFRGLALTIINKSDHAIVSSTNYDTYGDFASSEALALALGGLTQDQIGILSSFDAWEANVSVNLRAAFQRLGLTKAQQTNSWRQPYAAIFEGASSGLPSSKAVEVLLANDIGQPYAEIRGWLMDGGYSVTPGTAQNALYNNTGNVQAAIVDNAGNVGIGTTTPTAKLDVAGDLKVSGAISSTGSIIASSITLPDGSLTTAKQTTLYNSSGTASVVVNADGKVNLPNGLVTTLAGQTLELTPTGIAYGSGGTRTESKNNPGDGGGRSGFYETSSPAPASSWYPGASSWQHLIEARHSNVHNNFALQIAGSFYDQSLWFRKTADNPSASWSRFVVENPAGNVGIGTSTPQGRLDIFNSTNAATTPLLSLRSDFAAAGRYGMIRFGDQTQTTTYQKGAIIYESVATSARGKLHLALENTDGSGSVALSDAKLTVQSNGNVGIGTTAPTAKLDVVGDAKISGTLTVKTVLRIPQSGDLDMGIFKTGTNPNPPAN